MEIRIEKVEEINEEMIQHILNELAKKRPIFYNEQDFQFELADMFRKLGDNIEVRLEYRNYVTENDKENVKNYIDIVIMDRERNAISIELKYKMKIHKKGCEKVKDKNNEIFNLVAQGAQDHASYYFWRDVSRIENTISKKDENFNFIRGFAIFLTNDDKYWIGLTKGTCFGEFSLKNKRKLIKKDNEPTYLRKRKRKGNGKINFPRIRIQGNYELEWKDYSYWENNQFEGANIYVNTETKQDNINKDYFEYKYLILDVI